MTTPLTDATALPAPLSQALAEKGYDALTPVQSAVLETGHAGRDLLVSAQTGSGKTVAFGLAMAETLLAGAPALPPPDAPRALIIAPTRELALQVRRELEWLYARTGAAIASCVGGMDMRNERRALERGAHIVVGTPGRLRDHLERGSLDLTALAVAVLDEADEMLDLGFREDLEFLLEAAPAERRTLMFSATLSPGITRLAGSYQRDALRIATEGAREAHSDITYRALTVAPEDAENAIVNVLRYYEARNALVFCKTRAMVNHLTARFLNRGLSVVPLSGELAQEERARALQAMRDGRARVCVATDVAARGIDLPGLELVIHADLPTNAETLKHRSGRTGRAGRKGVSALIVPLSARRRTERLLSMSGVSAEWGPAPGAAEITARDTERLLTDPALTAPEGAAEQGMITLMVERFTARELAAGVLRQYFAARSAPEEIIPVTDDGPKPRARADFERSFWVALGIGAAARAEPRWLLPMLCRAGDLTRADIGAIRIFEDRTLVQLHADCTDRFFAAIGAGAQLEQGISVSRAEAPAEGDRPERPRTERPRPERPRTERPRPDRPRPERAPRAPRPAGETTGDPAAKTAERPAERAPEYRAEHRPEPRHEPRPEPRTERPARGSDRPKPPARKPGRDDGDSGKRPFRPGGKPAPYARKGEGRATAHDGETGGKPAYRRPDRPGKAPDGARPPRKPGTPDRAPRPAGERAGSGPGTSKPAAPRIDPALARDPSARLERPGGGGRPGARPGKPVRGSGGKGPGMGSGKGPGKGGSKGPGKGGAGGSARPTRPRKG